MTLIFDQKCLETTTSSKQGASKKSKEIQTKILKNYLNIVSLMILNKKKPVTGYDILKIILQKQGIRLNVSEIYRVLHSLEEDQFIERKLDENAKTVYSLTPKGKLLLTNILESKKEIELFTSKIFDSSAY